MILRGENVQIGGCGSIFEKLQTGSQTRHFHYNFCFVVAPKVFPSRMLSQKILLVVPFHVLFDVGRLPGLPGNMTEEMKEQGY